MSQKQKYIEEYEKYKHIELCCSIWHLKSNHFIKYEILDISENIITLKTVHTGNIVEKTPHWCRKNLEKTQ